MAAKFVQSLSVSFAGQNYPMSVTKTTDRDLGFEETVAAAKAGTLTTRTDANTGTITLSTGHGILDADVVDVYWKVGEEWFCQYQVTVGTVSGNAVPIDSGVGTDLPTTSTVVYVKKCIVKVLTITAADILAFVLHSKHPGMFVITRADNTVIFAVLVQATTADCMYTWFDGSGVASPLSNTVGKVFMSHPKTTGTVVMKGRFGAND